MTPDPTADFTADLTASDPSAEPTTGSTGELTAAELVDLVAELPGVRGIEPGVGTTLRTLDARIRRADAGASHFGLHVDSDAGTVKVEICVDRSRPVRESVRDIQQTLQRALRDTLPAETEFHVRVQSLSV